ncbi:piggyBac transposable element-derived protein 2-like [Watersipora subatra]|uniref:piggyBac transposable element-derived protein 2-like n=1 Tax=Watersipora subatra TaxID=2589382 RepID=UPI00355C746B
MGKCELKSEKEIRKQGRGASDERVERTHNISAVRWFDNRAVAMLSTLTGCETVVSAKRWDKTTKQQKDVTMPSVIGDYNRNMGGIDLLDSYLAKYRYKMRSRR